MILLPMCSLGLRKQTKKRLFCKTHFFAMIVLELIISGLLYRFQKNWDLINDSISKVKEGKNRRELNET